MAFNQGRANLNPLVLVSPYTGGVLNKAPYGPAGIPAHQATMKWLIAARNCTVTSLSCTTNAGNYPIASGDLLIIAASISNLSGTTDYAMQCPAGFTQVQGADQNDTTESQNATACYKFAGGSESGAYAFSWNTGGGANRHGWVMMDYANVASVDQVKGGVNTTTASPKTPSGLITTSSNETVVSILALVSTAVSANPVTAASGANTRYRAYKSGSVPQLMVVDRYGVASGSNPQETYTMSASDTSASYTLTLVPN
jgi:hypothetical protein